MKKSMESKMVEKIKNTSSLLWAIRLAFIALIGGSGLVLTKAQELTGWLAKDTIKAEIEISEERQSKAVEKQFENLMTVLIKAFPEVEAAAKEKLSEDEKNDVLLKAINR